MLNPEIFCNEYRSADGTWQTARFQDESEEPIPHDAEIRYGDRRPYVLIPVPGESSWVTESLQKEANASLGIKNSSPATATAPTTTKRAREERAAVEDDTMSMSIMATDASEDEDIHHDDDAATRHRGGGGADEASVLPADKKSGNSTDITAAPVSFPSGACMIYVYTSTDDTIKLNDVIEVVGVISHVPELAALHLEHSSSCTAAGNGGIATQAMTMLDEEMLVCHPPTSQVPRIHSLLVRKETTTTTTTTTVTLTSDDDVDTAEVRARTSGFLSMILGGDNLAAEYLLLQLTACVQHRTSDGAVGVFPLNLTSCPTVDPTTTTTTTTTTTNTTTTTTTTNSAKEGASASVKRGLSPFGEALFAAIEALVPRCSPLPLSLEKLNGASWVPRRGAEELLMSSGALQLAAGTQLLADETVMQSGQLNEAGLRNLAALQNVMQNQKLGYDFQFFTMDQQTDVPVTILSTARTMLKGVGEVVVPLQPTAPLAMNSDAVAATVVNGNGVESARRYLCAVRAASGEFSIPETVAEVLEKDLAGAKQKDSSLTPAIFHQWLNLARLLAVSYGEKELTQERWSQALQMERQRSERMVAVVA